MFVKLYGGEGANMQKFINHNIKLGLGLGGDPPHL